MFSRRVRVEYEADGKRQPCPLKWLDSFAMRSFTNSPVFDDTLPAADGLLEIGARVPLRELRAAMEDWFRRKSYLPREAVLIVEER
ncbi:MAG TPA: hypothetical protein VNK82_00950 [Terriglobales bacterium]|nr:hypothetical protein [Terriglobales bacterium]